MRRAEGACYGYRVPAGMRKESPITNSTPGPSPWYLRLPGAPCIDQFYWQERHGTGGTKTLLVGPQGPVAALGFQNYVKVLDAETLLIWFQQPRRSGAPSFPVELLVLKPRVMEPLRGDLDFLAIPAGARPILLESAPIAQSKLDTTRVEGDLHAEFPAQLETFEELLILCSSSAIGGGPIFTGDLALLVANPSKSSYRLYPQDWYNRFETDFGYEWVTRVARNPRTGRIHGDGIRIGAFVLDESLRKVEGGFGPA
jgi:hypothetical protein